MLSDCDNFSGETCIQGTTFDVEFVLVCRAILIFGGTHVQTCGYVFCKYDFYMISIKAMNFWSVNIFRGMILGSQQVVKTGSFVGVFFGGMSIWWSIFSAQSVIQTFLLCVFSCLRAFLYTLQTGNSATCM